jgi:flagellar L-ring protein precursor FlgH
MKRLWLLLLLLLQAGCIHEPQERILSTIPPQMERPRQDYSNGSIWQSASAGLVEDFKARTKGDTVTVVITEQASASKSATTSTDRTTAVSAGIPNLLGVEGKLAHINKWIDVEKLLSADTSSKYDGSGSTTRKENLNATITARVVEVLDNGNFLIEGRRNVKVNNEDQIIVMEGIIRPKDISADNIIYSTQIADARISYSGKGIISDRQKPGWLMNFLDYIWPF